MRLLAVPAPAQGCAGLQHLTLSNNPIATGVGGQRLPDYRKTVIGRMKALTCLDHHPIHYKVCQSDIDPGASCC